MFITVVAAILIALNLGWAFGAWWVTSGTRRAARWRWLTCAFVLLQIAGLLWVLSMRYSGPLTTSLLEKGATAVIFIWHLTLLPLFVSILWVGLGAWGVSAILRRLFGKRVSSVPEPGSVSRREMIGATLAALPPILAGTSAALAVTQMEKFRIRKLEIGLSGLPPGLDGFTIAQLSDLHCGPFTSGDVLEEILQATNDLKPDLALFTGDLINTSLSDLPEAVRMLQQVKAQHGLYVIEGNHDLIHNGREFQRGIREAGLNLLVNEQATLKIGADALQLLGLQWGGPRSGAERRHDRGDDGIAASMRELLELRDSSATPVLLAHHPHAFDAAVTAGIGLTLSGHTHGGQLMLNERLGFGPVLFRYWSGLYRKGGSSLVVSNGVGNWFPLRTAAPAEIVHLTLRRS